jgi:hypothetical protein
MSAWRQGPAYHSPGYKVEEPADSPLALRMILGQVSERGSPTGHHRTSLRAWFPPQHIPRPWTYAGGYRWRWNLSAVIWPVYLVRSRSWITAAGPGVYCVSDGGDDRAEGRASGWPGPAAAIGLLRDELAGGAGCRCGLRHQ